MGGSTSKASSTPQHQPSAPQAQQYAPQPQQYAPQPQQYAPQPQQYAPQPQPSDPQPQPSAPQPQPQASAPIIVVTNRAIEHAANNYIIPKIDIPASNSDQRSFTMPLGSKVDKYSMKVCAKYCSRKGCVHNFCYRFHVCQFWIKSSCIKEDCPFDHDFTSAHNKVLLQYLLHRRFGEEDMKEQLKKSFFIGKALKESLSDSICMDHVTKQCRRGNNCEATHADSPYLWEFMFQNHWIQFHKFQNIEIEKSFCDIQNSFVYIDIKSTKTKDNHVLQQIFPGKASIKINFDTMTVTSGEPVIHCPLRRISTPSDVGYFKNTATRWQWYWEDEFGSWKMYQNALIKDFWILPFSDYIESQYLKKADFTFQVNSNSYEMNFQTMTQTNQSTYVSRKIKRRPLAHAERLVWKTNTTFQSLWTIPNSSEKFLRQTVSPNSPEFHFVQSMFARTVSAHSLYIERVENPHLWKAYQLKKSQMMKGCDDNEQLSEQYLFHGTCSSVVDKICLDNLDWRLYGTNVGNIYGKGTYFANSASISLNYTPTDELGYRYMFIVIVLVGTATIGNQNMTFPPVNPYTKKRFDSTVNDVNPAIFVKYNLDEYYPAYLVKFT